MNTRITKGLGVGYWLSLSDDDMEHRHDDFGHAFPATREQLRILRAQIDAALTWRTPE